MYNIEGFFAEFRGGAFPFAGEGDIACEQRRPAVNDIDSDSETTAVDDPIAIFLEWQAKAATAEVNDPEAMALATADKAGYPNVRMVLLKGADQSGFVFFTNRESAKGRELEANPRAALCLHWKSLRRQVRVQGSITRVSEEEADAYFATRPKDSQIGAWASKQSREMEGRFVFEREIARFAAKYALSDVPRPAYWVGYRLAPIAIEFWRDRPFRLHDRLVFRRENLDAEWQTARLFP